MEPEKNQDNVAPEPVRLGTGKPIRLDIFKWVIVGLACFIIIVLIFSLGMFIGGMKAQFSYRWAESYHKNFAGPGGGFLEGWRKPLFPPGDFIEAHGAFGEIIEVKNTEFVIKGRGDVEKVILITDKTIIQEGREKVKKEDLKAGNWVVVIGSPNEEGKIEAKMIRIFDGKEGIEKPPILFNKPTPPMSWR